MTTQSGSGAFEIGAGRGAMAAYLALPEGGHGRGVLVLHEAWGLVDAMREVCDRLARADFVALAPDLFRGERAETIEVAGRLAGGLRRDAVAADLEAGVSALMDHPAVDGSRVGVLGFCLGGHLALLAAECSPRVGAAVDFYGFHPALPVELDRIGAPVLVIHAEDDAYVPAERTGELRAAFEAPGRRSAVHVEPGVTHGFMNPDRPEVHDAAAAASGWDRLLAFLRAELS